MEAPYIGWSHMGQIGEPEAEAPAPGAFASDPAPRAKHTIDSNFEQPRLLPLALTSSRTATIAQTNSSLETFVQRPAPKLMDAAAEAFHCTSAYSVT